MLAEAQTGPGDDQSSRLSVSSWRNGSGGERATGARGSG
jgi:hypothetical protein